MIIADNQDTQKDSSLWVRRLLDLLEPIWLLGLMLAFWYRSPTRDTWHFLLLGIPVLWGLRWLVYGRLWTITPLTGWLMAFVFLGFVNVVAAPFRRAPNDALFSALTLMGRPLMGIALVVYFVEMARLRGSMGLVVRSALLAGALVAILALGASQWNTKSLPFQFITDALPRIDGTLSAFYLGGGFNAN